MALSRVSRPESMQSLINDDRSIGNEHFWVSTVLESMGQASLSDTLSRFPLMARLYMRLNPKWLEKLVEGSARHEKYTMNLIQKYGLHPFPQRVTLTRRRRIKEKTDRKDFMSYLLQEQEDSKEPLSTIQLAAHASDFVLVSFHACDTLRN